MEEEAGGMGEVSYERSCKYFRWDGRHGRGYGIRRKWEEREGFRRDEGPGGCYCWTECTCIPFPPSLLLPSPHLHNERYTSSILRRPVAHPYIL